MDYSDVPALADVYLEDSFVLEIVEEAGALRFTIEAVLTERHPDYRPPGPDEQYCYADAHLMFTSTTAIEWISRAAVSFTDASGETDLGNIDEMVRVDDHWRISGDWGEVNVYTPDPPELHILAAGSSSDAS
ncbi:hypothetical protein CLV30_12072 [Haloactinopolyspora alba]|uniref:Uncharacterized protein n=2 Tax=Haloactinopolyspora alba TaxID=648780 RepID=A0A2P8DM54_9ACTN|nr:hypothetical protein CLV30_12072 [Haloactinopolyspora alba]